ncbi:MAG TPA: ATP-dependent Clp protease ATP-binding subunit [Pseudonocardia sp.]|jgi:ATP-dependent Clp protease ATP-binding subunit ClpC|nr:ATP-dependent Clp protease ATP-binding subunit [Pseudonocardia sp.]
MPQEPFGPLFGFEELVKGLVDGLEHTLGGFVDPDPDAERRDQPGRDSRPGATQAPRTDRRTPTLNRFGRDLTDEARRGLLDPVIGRDDVVDQVLEVLVRRSKNNPVLIGDPGVGKTAIVEGIAARIVAGAVPEALRGRRIVVLDLARIVAGTRYRGDFEERLNSVIDEVLAGDRDIVLFLDELHTVVGAGSGEGVPMDAANMLKPALARGGLQLIGATTVEEYRKHLGGDAALERRLQPILVAEPSVADTIMILRGLRGRYEQHHRVTITEAAIEAAARLSDRYLTDRFLPDKAIDLIDRAGARVGMRTDGPSGSEVTDDDVAAVVAASTGIPVARLTELDRHRLLNLEGLLSRRVVGQGEAIASVADAVRAGRAGLAHPERPVGSFLFLGPTGVGKTELARALASVLFDTDDRLVRFDMTEFSDRHTVSRLIGAPPGYVGHDEPGRLTEAVRRTPYTVLLFDEIEKAHPDVLGILLQVLDAGRLTDARGRLADFTNTVIIMTSNLDDQLMRTALRPEFLNRIDDVVRFHALGRTELRAITELALAQTRQRLEAQGIGLDVGQPAVDWLAERGYEPEFGARPLRRVVGRELERELSRLVLGEKLGAGQQVVVSVAEDGEHLTLDVRPAPKPA